MLKYLHCYRKTSNRNCWISGLQGPRLPGAPASCRPRQAILPPLGTWGLWGVALALALLIFPQPAPAGSSGASSTSVLSQSCGVSPFQALCVGRRIWKNECDGTVAGLTFWNPGEGFPSLGIGHFIWYPRGREDRFEESFPGLIAFCLEREATVPGWLVENRHCPWPTRAEFLADLRSPRMTELRTFLATTITLQAEFIALRLVNALPRIAEALDASGRKAITTRFEALFRTPQGLYALMDYVNCKGEGIKVAERYAGQGWGLLQVLQGMRGFPEGDEAVREFAASACRVLERRVSLAPGERRDLERKFLIGWRKRVLGYAAPEGN